MKNILIALIILLFFAHQADAQKSETIIGQPTSVGYDLGCDSLGSPVFLQYSSFIGQTCCFDYIDGNYVKRIDCNGVSWPCPGIIDFEEICYYIPKVSTGTEQGWIDQDGNYYNCDLELLPLDTTLTQCCDNEITIGIVAGQQSANHPNVNGYIVGYLTRNPNSPFNMQFDYSVQPAAQVWSGALATWVPNANTLITDWFVSTLNGNNPDGINYGITEGDIIITDVGTTKSVVITGCLDAPNDLGVAFKWGDPPASYSSGDVFSSSNCETVTSTSNLAEKVDCNCNYSFLTSEVCLLDENGNCIQNFIRTIQKLSDCEDTFSNNEQTLITDTDITTGEEIETVTALEGQLITYCNGCEDVCIEACFICDSETAQPTIDPVRPIKVQIKEIKKKLTAVKALKQPLAAEEVILVRSLEKKLIKLTESKFPCEIGETLQTKICGGVAYDVSTGEVVDTTGFLRIECGLDICTPETTTKIVGEVDTDIPVEFCGSLCTGTVSTDRNGIGRGTNFVYGGNTYADFQSFVAATGATLECKEITCHVSTITINNTDPDNVTESFTYDVFGNTRTVDLVCEDKEAVVFSLKEKCDNTYTNTAKCLSSDYTDADGNTYPSSSVIVVVTGIDCNGKIVSELIYDAQSIIDGDPAQIQYLQDETGVITPEYSEDCTAEIQCSFKICDANNMEFTVCQLFTGPAGDPVVNFYNENGMLAIPLAPFQPCEKFITTEQWCAYTAEGVFVESLQKHKVFDLSTAQLFSSKWTIAKTDIEFDITDFEIRDCGWSPIEYCEVPDQTAEPIIQVCYDLSAKELPTTGTTWNYNSTNQLICTGSNGARSELILFGANCEGGVNSYCPANVVPSDDPANASELLTANTTWGNGDNADYGDPSETCGQWVANAWLNYPLSGTANSITVSYDQPNTSCSGGYGVFVFDACANAYIPFINGTQTNSGSTLSSCGATGFRHPCTTQGTYSGQFDASSVSDLSCLWVVTWAHSRFTSTPLPATTGVDMVSNMLMNGVLPSSSACDWNSCESIAEQLTNDDVNNNIWACNDSGQVCATITIGEAGQYGDLVSSNWTCTPAVTSTQPTILKPVVLTKPAVIWLSTSTWQFCYEGQPVELQTWSDGSKKAETISGEVLEIAELGCCDCNTTTVEEGCIDPAFTGSFNSLQNLGVVSTNTVLKINVNTVNAGNDIVNWHNNGGTVELITNVGTFIIDVGDTVVLSGTTMNVQKTGGNGCPNLEHDVIETTYSSMTYNCYQ